MQREDVSELHYITPIANLSSMMKLGILSHKGAKSIPHKSVALDSVQQKRASILLPNITRLHSYVNLYFDARNPMMYYLHESHQELVILRIRHEILDAKGVWIADGNSTVKGKTSFFAPNDEGFSRIDKQSVFAVSWVDPDPIVMREKKRRRCAEALIPDIVPATSIVGL